MSAELPRRRTLDHLKKEAKRWLAALQDGEPDAEARFARAVGGPSVSPTLRDVQHALAREHGFAGWSALKVALAPDPAVSARSLGDFDAKAAALLDAYDTGTPEALERHYRQTWHRRPWAGMRSYVQADLGRRPSAAGDDVAITLDDARHLVAIEHGFEDWAALRTFVATMPGGTTITARPTRVVSPPPRFESRDWRAVLDALAGRPDAVLDAAGQMTDAMLAEVTRVGGIQALRLGGSKALTDDGIRHLARLPLLRHLDLSDTAVTDAGLAVLRQLPALESLSLAMTRVTDRGIAALAESDRLERLNLMWTGTGDGALRALAGKPRLRDLRTGNDVTDAGLALLHEIPVFKRWHGGETTMALLSYEAGPNYLSLRGSFTDDGVAAMRGLDGLFALNLDDSSLAITKAALDPLVGLPHLGWLAVDARDDWMPAIAAMPKLQFLGCQDTTAGDDGFASLSRSASIEYIWGRRCHNLGRRGFTALAQMPRLKGLSVSCLNVDDAGLAALPRFPALRELMPMDVPDAGYRHIGECHDLKSLILMYCRDTTDLATEAIVPLPRLSAYFNSYTAISDRTPALLSGMDSLERITFDSCQRITDEGVGALARLPRLRELRLSGGALTPGVVGRFPARVAVHYSP